MPGPTVTPAVAGGTVAVLVNVTGDPVSAARAVSVCGPPLSPRVRSEEAMPLAFDTGTESDIEPPPVPTTQWIVKPGTAFPCASLTTTVCGFGSVVVRKADCVSPVPFVIVAACPAVAVALKLTGDPVRPVTLACTVCAPAVAGRVRLEV